MTRKTRKGQSAFFPGCLSSEFLQQEPNEPLLSTSHCCAFYLYIRGLLLCAKLFCVVSQKVSKSRFKYTGA